MQNLLLAARALGYGGVITGFHGPREAELRELLHLPPPESLAIVATIPLGRPQGRHGPVRRRPLPELVYDDAWESARRVGERPAGHALHAGRPAGRVTAAVSGQRNAPFADDLALALRLADEASALALDCLRAGVVTSQKSDGSVVTDADVAVERMLVDAFASHRPFDAILGEELGAAVGSGHRRWILDPIDGTRGFIAGRPDWGVHIALESHGRIVVGVVTRPASSRRWWASQGAGAYVGRLYSADPVRRLHVSTRATLDDALVSGWLFDDDPARARLRSLPSFSSRAIWTTSSVSRKDVSTQ